ncbi:MAG: hypothetical protein KME21_27525 [Desmonostoc vinosum HA7617-LM4]|nr:hypothetical protein [Desmonostoc vinosum HA7617-LM4]
MLLTSLSIAFNWHRKFLGKSRVALRETQNKTLAEDVKAVLSYKAFINTKTKNTVDNTRILGILAAAKGSENYLPYTIPKIIQQVSEIGLMADIIIGLNNGFECPTVIDRFTLLTDVQIIHLYTEEKIVNNIPAKIFDNLMCKGKPYDLANFNVKKCKHRIFVVHQREGQYSAGKIRVLGDIYGSLLLKSTCNGWIPPALLIAFDAESQFLCERKYPIVEPNTNGLKIILNQFQRQPEIDVLGTRQRHIVYQQGIEDGIEILLPNFDEDLPPIQWFMNIAHGRINGFMYKPGGGTVGRTDVIISLISVIAERYPGMKLEDSHLSILAKHAGFKGDIFIDVICTNRVPSLTDMTMDNPPKKSWIEQIYRWNTTHEAMKLLYGEHNIKEISHDGFPWFGLKKIVPFWQRVFTNEKLNLYTVYKKLKVLTIALLTSRKIRNRSMQNPEVLQGSKAKASW